MEGHPHGCKNAGADHQQSAQHQSAPGQLGGIQLSWVCHSFQQLPGAALVLQLAAAAGQHRYAEGQDDGVDEGQIVEQQHPPPGQVLRILPGEKGPEPEQFYPQHRCADQDDVPPAALETFQFQQVHRLAAFPVSSKKMSSRLFCRSSSRRMPSRFSAKKPVSRAVSPSGRMGRIR